MPTAKKMFPGMPITEIVYGEDHPDKRPPYPAWEPTHPGTRIASLIETTTLKRLARSFPKCKKYLPRKEV